MIHQVRCKIARVTQLTSTVRQLILRVPEESVPHVQFRPGQWVDFWPSGYDRPGGFSISSSPIDLPEIELAIKYSPHSVVQWIHSESCTPDEHVTIKIGGEWFLKEKRENEKCLLLVAGGVGINPILAMLRHLGRNPSESWEEIRLVYAARNWDDILYKDEVMEVMSQLPQLSVSIHLSDESEHFEPPQVDRVEFHRHRLKSSDLVRFDVKHTVAYLCGPPKMSDAVNSWLNSAAIHYEKWW